MNPYTNPPPRPQPRSAYALIALGIVIGAVSMAGISTGVGTSRAFAQEAPAGPRLAGSNTTESLAELRNLDNSFANLAAFVGPSVVDIKATTDGSRRGTDGQRLPQSGGEGSGFIIGANGTILTNDHVVGKFDKVTVTLRDGREYPGKVIRAEESDIAVVKIDAKDLPALSFADSRQVRPGAFVMAIGTPFGLENSVTVGHVSALHRADTVIQRRLYPDLIQTDASINMGNSGGPLVNIDGQVIGINTAIYSPSGTSAGIGFAIPSNQAQFIANQLLEKGKVTRAFLGVAPETVKEFRAKELGIEGGAVIKEIPTEGPGAVAGLRKEDIITRIAQTVIRDSADLRLSMLRYAPGTEVEVEFYRDGKRQTTKATLKTAPKPAIQPDVTEDGVRQFQFGPGEDPFKDLPKEFLSPFRNQPKADPTIPDLSEDGPRLGVAVENLTDTTRKQYRIPASAVGAVVRTVASGSLAERTGIRIGDLITQIGSKKVSDVKTLREIMAGLKNGQETTVKYGRFTGTSRQELTKSVQF